MRYAARNRELHHSPRPAGSMIVEVQAHPGCDPRSDGHCCGFAKLGAPHTIGPVASISSVPPSNLGSAGH